MGEVRNLLERYRREEMERKHEENSITYSVIEHAQSPEGHAKREAYRKAEMKKAEEEKKNSPSHPRLKYYQMIFKPGSLMVTSRRRGGGKTHAAVSYAQMLVEGRFPELGKWKLVTNIIFLRKDRDEFVTDYPEGVQHITTMKKLFPIAADALEKGENILLILDEAQNFLLASITELQRSTP